MPQRSKYSPEIVDKIVSNIKLMKGRVGSSNAAGINFDTFNTWMCKFPAFAETIKKAEEEFLESAKSVAIMSIFQAMSKSWQAAAWWLERNYPSIYALRTNNLQGDVHITLAIPRPQPQQLTKAEVVSQVKRLTNTQPIDIQQEQTQPVVCDRYDSDDFVEVKTS